MFAIKCLTGFLTFISFAILVSAVFLATISKTSLFYPKDSAVTLTYVVSTICFVFGCISCCFLSKILKSKISKIVTCVIFLAVWSMLIVLIVWYGSFNSSLSHIVKSSKSDFHVYFAPSEDVDDYQLMVKKFADHFRDAECMFRGQSYVCESDWDSAFLNAFSSLSDYKGEEKSKYAAEVIRCSGNIELAIMWCDCSYKLINFLSASTIVFSIESAICCVFVSAILIVIGISFWRSKQNNTQIHVSTIV